MARSTYCYVVLKPFETSAPVATFTVKRELIIWLNRRDDRWVLEVWRCQDGINQSKPAVKMDLHELLDD